MESYFATVRQSTIVKLRYEPTRDKTNKVSVRPAKTQISLGIRPVWSESSLCAQWVAKDPSFLHADSEDSDQTGRMPRLIWDFAGCTLPLLVLSRGSSYIDALKKYQWGMLYSAAVDAIFCSSRCYILQHLSDLGLHFVKVPISLGINPVWSETLLFALRSLGSLATHWEHSKDSDQTGRMPRLISVFGVRTGHFVGFVMQWLK